MLVFWDQRLAFLATPKTGSTAIEFALESLSSLVVQRPPVLKHTTAQRFHRFLGPYLNVASGGHDFEVVALMREPRDWLGSWYRYRQRDEADAGRSTHEMSFDTFVQGWCADEQPEFAKVGSQARFLESKNGKGVDRIFRYEDITAFTEFLEDRLGCEILLPRMNVSPAGATELSPETTALLHKVGAREFDLYASLA